MENARSRLVSRAGVLMWKSGSLFPDFVLQVLSHGEMPAECGKNLVRKGFDFGISALLAGLLEELDGLLVVAHHVRGIGLVEIGAGLGVGHLGLTLGDE